MKLTIDTEKQKLTLEEGSEVRTIDLYTKEAFELISRQWVKVGWNQKYPYTFSWMGRPIIQLPEDMIRMQEVIFQVKPDVIIETGVAHGGSLIYYASICKAMEKGRIIGIDIEIRSHNRTAIESHPLKEYITLIEGSSTDINIVNQVKNNIKTGEVVLVILDSNHTYDHVYAELLAYSSMVTPFSYIVATDGIMHDLSDVPRGTKGWKTDNPTNAARNFVKEHPEFEVCQPTWPFNESELSENITHWPGAWLKRIA